MRIVLRWVPRHVWVQLALGRVGPAGWAVPMYRGIVIDYTASVGGWGVSVFRMPETELTRQAAERYGSHR